MDLNQDGALRDRWDLRQTFLVRLQIPFRSNLLPKLQNVVSLYKFDGDTGVGDWFARGALYLEGDRCHFHRRERQYQGQAKNQSAHSPIILSVEVCSA